MSRRTEAVRGTFYPFDKKDISAKLNDFFSNVNTDKIDNLHGIIVPHAGIIYSGQTAAYAYGLIPKNKFKKVIILAPNHTVYLAGAIEDSNSFWLTPYGNISIEHLGSLNADSEAHENEHAIEVQLPFLSYILGKYTLVPIVVGTLTRTEIKEISDQIIKSLTDDTILLISTDLSHYLEESLARNADARTIKEIETLENNLSTDACGKYPLVILKEICKQKGWNPKLINYSTSGDVDKDKSNVIGYASFWF